MWQNMSKNVGELKDQSSYETVYIPDPDEDMNFNISFERANKRNDIVRNTRRKSCTCSYCGNYKLHKGDRIILENEKIGYMLANNSSYVESDHTSDKRSPKSRGTVVHFGDRRDSFAHTIRNFKNVMNAIQYMRRKRRTRYGSTQDIEGIDENEEIFMPMNQFESIFNNNADSDKK